MIRKVYIMLFVVFAMTAVFSVWVYASTHTSSYYTIDYIDGEVSSTTDNGVNHYEKDDGDSSHYDLSVYTHNYYTIVDCEKVLLATKHEYIYHIDGNYDRTEWY